MSFRPSAELFPRFTEGCTERREFRGLEAADFGGGKFHGLVVAFETGTDRRGLREAVFEAAIDPLGFAVLGIAVGLREIFDTGLVRVGPTDALEIGAFVLFRDPEDTAKCFTVSRGGSSAIADFLLVGRGGSTEGFGRATGGHFGGNVEHRGTRRLRATFSVPAGAAKETFFDPSRSRTCFSIVSRLRAENALYSDGLRETCAFGCWVGRLNFVTGGLNEIVSSSCLIGGGVGLATLARVTTAGTMGEFLVGITRLAG